MPDGPDLVAVSTQDRQVRLEVSALGEHAAILLQPDVALTLATHLIKNANKAVNQ